MCAVFLRKADHSNHRIGAHTDANHTVPYGTALLRWHYPRHFMPGYDHTSLRDWGKAPSASGQQIVSNIL